MAAALAYWYAFRDPIRNRAIVVFGIADNSLATVALVVLAFTTGLASWYYWVSMGFTAFFAVGFFVLCPKDEEWSPATAEA
jgi:hypothetical protein